MPEAVPIQVFAPAERRPADFPDELPFLAEVGCWVARTERGVLVVWSRGDPPTVQDGIAGLLSRREIERVVRDAENQDVMRHSLLDLMMRLRGSRPSRPERERVGATPSSMTDDGEAIVAQSTKAGWIAVPGGAAPGPSRALRWGGALRFITTDAERGTTILYETGASPSPGASTAVD